MSGVRIPLRPPATLDGGPTITHVWVLGSLVAGLVVLALGSWLITRRQRKQYRRQAPDGIASVEVGRESITTEGGPTPFY